MLGPLYSALGSNHTPTPHSAHTQTFSRPGTYWDCYITISGYPLSKDVPVMCIYKRTKMFKHILWRGTFRGPLHVEIALKLFDFTPTPTSLCLQSTFDMYFCNKMLQPPTRTCWDQVLFVVSVHRQIMYFTNNVQDKSTLRRIPKRGTGWNQGHIETALFSLPLSLGMYLWCICAW